METNSFIYQKKDGAGFKYLGRIDCWVWRLNAGCGDWKRNREHVVFWGGEAKWTRAWGPEDVGEKEEVAVGPLS